MNHVTKAGAVVLIAAMGCNSRVPVQTRVSDAGARRSVVADVVSEAPMRTTSSLDAGSRADSGRDAGRDSRTGPTVQLGPGVSAPITATVLVPATPCGDGYVNTDRMIQILAPTWASVRSDNNERSDVLFRFNIAHGTVTGVSVEVSCYRADGSNTTCLGRANSLPSWARTAFLGQNFGTGSCAGLPINGHGQN